MNACLYCGKKVAGNRPLHGGCHTLKITCVSRKRSSYWELLKVLANRGDTGIRDKVAVLDEWEELGIIQRDSQGSEYRYLTERGKQLYEHILVRRLKRFSEESEVAA